MSGGTFNEPDYLIRIHLRGEVPSNITAIINDFPDRELSGDAYETRGFNKLGKVFKVNRKDIRVQFLNCNKRKCTGFSQVEKRIYKMLGA